MSDPVRKTLFERFARLPRFAQLGIAAGLALVVYLVWSDYISPVTHSLRERANAIQEDVRIVRESGRIERELERMRPAILALGPVQVPRDGATGGEAMHIAVNEVLGAHQVSNIAFSFSQRGGLGRTKLASIVGGRQVQVLAGVLQFDAAPDVAARVIAELESRREIETISQLQMNRIAGRRVNVRLTLEAWVVGDEPARAGRGI
jgi:hypothetical protein